MLEIKLIITLAPEVLNLIKGLSGTTKFISKTIQNEPEAKKETATKQTELIEDATETAPAVTLKEIRSLASKAVKKDRSAVKKLLTEFKASSVSALDKKYYDKFYKKIGELV